MSNQAFGDFIRRLALLVRKHPRLMSMTLSNILAMRQIGAKTHGDLAEIAICEFVNQYMYDFRSTHVGKDLYRTKSTEEDITVTNEMTDEAFSISLKAYGNGPLQLSTDKHFGMFPELTRHGALIDSRRTIRSILASRAFAQFDGLNVLPLIYDEDKKSCNIMVFDFDRARESTSRIERIEPGQQRKHPVYRFHDAAGRYICEVRYGDAAANALQRGLWTHSEHAQPFFTSVTNGGGWSTSQMNGS